MLQQVRHPQLLLGEDRLQKLSATPCQARPGTLISVAAQSTNGSKAPEKAAPRQSSPTRASSGGGFFDSSVGSQFANRSESPKKSALAPRQSSPTRASSGGGFFDKSVGSEFANRSESPRRAAPKQTSSPRASSGKGFFDSPAPSSTSGKQLLPLLLLHSQVMFGSFVETELTTQQQRPMHMFMQSFGSLL